MSKYDVEKFDPPPDPDLICCICHCVLDRAVESPCQHVFCQVCIERWLTNRHTCPTCRKRTRKPDLKPVLPLVQNMLNRLPMICDYRENGCLEKIMLEHYKTHISNCGYEMKSCRFNKCKLGILKMNLELHERDECDHRETLCTGKCGLMVALSDVCSHDCVESLKQHIDEKDKLIDTLKTKLQELNNLSRALKEQMEQFRGQLIRRRPFYPSSFTSSDTDVTDFSDEFLDDLSRSDTPDNDTVDVPDVNHDNNTVGDSVATNNTAATVTNNNNSANDIPSDPVSGIVNQVERTVVHSLFDLGSRLDRVRTAMRLVLDSRTSGDNNTPQSDLLISLPIMSTPVTTTMASTHTWSSAFQSPSLAGSRRTTARVNDLGLEVEVRDSEPDMGARNGTATTTTECVRVLTPTVDRQAALQRQAAISTSVTESASRQTHRRRIMTSDSDDEQASSSTAMPSRQTNRRRITTSDSDDEQASSSTAMPSYHPHDQGEDAAEERSYRCNFERSEYRVMNPDESFYVADWNPRLSTISETVEDGSRNGVQTPASPYTNPSDDTSNHSSDSYEALAWRDSYRSNWRDSYRSNSPLSDASGPYHYSDNRNISVHDNTDTISVRDISSNHSSDDHHDNLQNSFSITSPASPTSSILLEQSPSHRSTSPLGSPISSRPSTINSNLSWSLSPVSSPSRQYYPSSPHISDSGYRQTDDMNLDTDSGSATPTREPSSPISVDSEKTFAGECSDTRGATERSRSSRRRSLSDFFSGSEAECNPHSDTDRGEPHNISSDDLHGSDTDRSNHAPPSFSSPQQRRENSSSDETVSSERVVSPLDQQDSDSSEDSSIKYVTKRKRRYVSHEQQIVRQTRGSQKTQNNPNEGCKSDGKAVYCCYKESAKSVENREKTPDNAFNDVKTTSNRKRNYAAALLSSKGVGDQANSRNVKRERLSAPCATVTSSSAAAQSHPSKSQSLNVKIDLSLINFPSRIGPGGVIKSSSAASVSNPGGTSGVTRSQQNTDSTGAPLHLGTSKSSKTSIQTRCSADTSPVATENRYVTRSVSSNTATATRTQVSGRRAVSLGRVSSCHREFPQNWRDNSDSSSDEDWEPAGQTPESESWIVESDIESNSSYEVLIPKTASDLLNEYASDETDDSWDPDAE